ncbi:hypothetical protein QEZ52_20590 [Aliisedimentitalea scapharcae]|uniref:Sulfotransferase family protein n=1 Tax=Aliisedimentitalea scapharcae TaxID=1524259 RepID=A0ABZ2XUA8_9RHOB
MTIHTFDNPAFVEPRPLLLRQHNVAIAWSPKSACTHLAVWHFLKEGLLPACNHFHYWPHQYRTQVYYRGWQYQQRLREIFDAKGKGWTLVRYTRNPARRLVSQFRHAVQFKLIDELVKAKVGHDPAVDGLSMQDYYQALLGEDLTWSGGADVHVKEQRHPLWSWGFDRVVTINMDEVNLLEATQNMERELGIGVVDTNAHPKFQQVRNMHHAQDYAWEGNDYELLHHRFKREPGANRFPKRSLEKLEATQVISWALYGIDYADTHTDDIKLEACA